MEKQYVAPQVKTAGDAVNVVLGLDGAGFDLDGSIVDLQFEFLADDPMKTGR
jgi:hypothetical protein